MKPQEGHSYNGTLGGAQGGFEYKPLRNFYEALFVTWKQGHMEGHRSQRRSLLYIDVQERSRVHYGQRAQCMDTVYRPRISSYGQDTAGSCFK
jgi:hypothetical protein